MVEGDREGSSKTVFLAEDDAALRDVLTRLLAGAGYTVVAINDGRSLLELLTAVFLLEQGETRPDALILDIQMPGFTGLEVIDVLRQYDTATPIIVITAFPDEDLHVEARGHGVSAVLSKPFSGDALLATLRRLLP